MKQSEAIALTQSIGEAVAYHQILPQWSLASVPPHMRGGIVRWVLFGIAPGSFLRAVIAGDLYGAAAAADNENQRLLFDYAAVFYNHTPNECHGRTALDSWTGLKWDAEE